MPRKKMLKVSPQKLHKVIKRLRSIENDNPDLTIDNKAVSEFLLDISEFETSEATIEIEVKIAILRTDGVDDPDPDTLDNDKEMSDFNFSDERYQRLTERFIAIARKRNPSAKITVRQVRGCETVKDCVELVTEASKI